MSIWDSKTVRDVAEVDLHNGQLVRLELLAGGACLHVEGLQVRYQGILGDGYALFRHDARLLVFGVAEATVSGALAGDDPIATATMADEEGDAIPWRDALQGAPATSLQLELTSGVTVSLRCSRATLGLEDPGVLHEGWINDAPALSRHGSPAMGPSSTVSSESSQQQSRQAP